MGDPLATFNYIKAIWNNGSGVVSDAPGWVANAVERVLPVWMFAHERELVGVHHDPESGLHLAIFVSPGASGSESLLEDAADGSFVHVVASDRDDPPSPAFDDARALFESVYGAPLSDAAVRQQRNFMLLDFPYHRDLATDLFVSKDRVEPLVERSAPPAEPVESIGSSTAFAVEAADDSLSLGSLLGPRAPQSQPKPADGLPFDQGLSYQEVITRLGNAVQGNALQRARAAEPEHVPSPIADTRSVAPDLVAEVVAETQPGREPERDTRSRGAGAAEEATFDLAAFQPAPARRRSGAARDAWSPLYAAAGYALLLFLVLGVLAVASHLPVAPVDEGPLDEGPLPVTALAKPAPAPATAEAIPAPVAVEVMPAPVAVEPPPAAAIAEARDGARELLPAPAAVEPEPSSETATPQPPVEVAALEPPAVAAEPEVEVVSPVVVEEPPAAVPQEATSSGVAVSTAVAALPPVSSGVESIEADSTAATAMAAADAVPETESAGIDSRQPEIAAIRTGDQQGEQASQAQPNRQVQQESQAQPRDPQVRPEAQQQEPQQQEAQQQEAQQEERRERERKRLMRQLQRYR